MNEQIGIVHGIYRPVSDMAFVTELEEAVRSFPARLEEPTIQNPHRMRHIGQHMHPTKPSQIIMVRENILGALALAKPPTFDQPIQEIRTNTLRIKSSGYNQTNKKNGRPYNIFVGVDADPTFEAERTAFLGVEGIRDTLPRRNDVFIGRIVLQKERRVDDIRSAIAKHIPRSLSLLPGVVDLSIETVEL